MARIEMVRIIVFLKFIALCLGKLAKTRIIVGSFFLLEFYKHLTKVLNFNLGSF